ncbi:PilZ domain-containing protein [Teredinibacter sp. KSP-S5-2]|uniref:PilZ domain-containing protein n=1 Tax=Teredinibacter sp. KSP-S5-2 TaxID=3034506 RepID=UPI0029344E61|nr:PilZ domain-containing protein [Teredinibacter sp. KSP-S5-2]WNO09838.1 PilZ domain-containing protein [Teredinibacter sp. KSP-S5-2]
METKCQVMESKMSAWKSLYSNWLKLVFEGRSIMRRYIRHPSGIPIRYCLEESEGKAERLKDVSRGGLCFNSECPLRAGAHIRIEIPVDTSDYRADGQVAWCHQEGDHYAVGVKFEDTSTQYSVRMVEQVCHIEDYRVNVLQHEGRDLTSEEAAREWVAKYAADFPR